MLNPKIPRFGRERRFRLPLLESELRFDLTGENPENRLFGRYTAEEVRERIASAGLLDGLARRGYPEPLLVLSCHDPSEQRICLYAGRETRERLLFEARLQIVSFHPRRPIGPFTEDSSFRMLVIHWLVLSSPDGTFTVDRPRLPGQEKPGLGLLDETISLLTAFTRGLPIDGVLDVPDHFHTALFYSRAFRFLDPEAEGRFRAIARDLSGIPLALASDAIRQGCLIDRGSGRPSPWISAEQVMSTRGPLSEFLASAQYREAEFRAYTDHRFVVNWDLYREKIASKRSP